MDKDKLALLKAICDVAVIEERITLSFNSLSKSLEIPKERLDVILIELENERHLTQFVMEKSDNFIIALHQKGFDAVQDAVI